MRATTLALAAAASLAIGAPAFAQTPAPQTHQHEPTPQTPPSWHLMQDGVIYGLFNHQGGPRGGDEFVVPNWWMGVWTRASGSNELGVNAMVSLDPLSVGSQGYREIFQVGEAFEGQPLVDYQHPHDFVMQLAGTWRRGVGRSNVTIAGAIAGEPTLGPVAFMHRPSASGLPLAPLGHHTFDSTHISFGVVTAAIERGPWIVEGSAFNGREPDEHRWNLETGALDSFAARVWFTPTDAWSVQVSSGRLTDPEELSPGNAVRTTASAAWFGEDDDGFRAATVGYGVNSAHGERRHGVFGELSIERGVNAFSTRIEAQQVETTLLMTGELPHDDPGHGEAPATVAAVSVSLVRRLLRWSGFEGALGAQMTLYRVPDGLVPTHGKRPVSFQVFFRLRLPSGPGGRMWNMVMSRGHRMAADDHAGHAR